MLARSPGKSGTVDDRSILTTEKINLQGALQKVAYDLFKPPKGSFMTITRLHDHWRVHEGVSFEKYQVTLKKRGVLGTFLRMRAFPGGESTVDLALQLENGVVTAAEPIQPVVIRGVPFLAFPQLVLTLKEHQLSSYARGLSRIFQSLVFLEQASRGTDVPPLDEKRALLVAEFMKKKNPPLAPGVRMPAFSLKDEKGGGFGPAQLDGKLSLIVVGTIHDERFRDVLAWLGRYAGEHPDRFAIATVAMNRPPTIDQYRNRGGTFPGTLVADVEQSVYETFHCVFTPSVYAFDRQRLLQKHLEPVTLTDYEALARELDAIR
ncbi:MAG: hypothetical protein HY815_15810 [Candidatus Riflebacteria bacterium]|nr:hypothetical protein [Candidatus Riflebacteria bacterium]